MPASDEEHGKTICKVLMLCCLLVASCTILGVSFSVITPTEVGLYYNPNTKRLNRNKVWGSGRHLVCPGCDFKRYPSSYIPFVYSHMEGTVMGCWTSDKQELSIELFVQVKILPDKAADIYDKYQYNYFDPWSQKIQMALKQTTKDYNTESMFEERAVVTAAIKEEIESYLEDEGCEVSSVHVGQITIPTQFEDAITTKVVTQQNAATVLMQRNVTVIEAETAIIDSQADSDAAVIVGKANADASVIRERANADALMKVQQAEAEGLKEIMTELGFSVSQTLQFKFNRAIKMLGVETTVGVGYDDQYLSVKDRA